MSVYVQVARRLTGVLCAAAALSCAAAVATPVASATTVKAGTLERGDRGRDVKALQRALRIAVDGQFGSATRRAVRRFQRRHGLPATGRADARTLARLGLTGAPRTSRQSDDGGGGLSPGDDGDDTATTDDAPMRLSRSMVKELQAALGVTADGALGPKTRRAIRRYERRNGMRVDGRPDQALLDALGVGDEEEVEPTPTPTPSPTVTPGTETGTYPEAIAAAQSAIGSPYASGGTTTDGFDCSGLMVWAFKRAGVKLPRTSFDMYEEGTEVDQSEIAPGDLVFFDTAGSGASHVGIATGPTTVISATSRGVKEHPIDDKYWGSHYIGAKRL